MCEVVDDEPFDRAPGGRGADLQAVGAGAGHAAVEGDQGRTRESRLARPIDHEGHRDQRQRGEGKERIYAGAGEAKRDALKTLAGVGREDFLRSDARRQVAVAGGDPDEEVLREFGGVAVGVGGGRGDHVLAGGHGGHGGVEGGTAQGVGGHRGLAEEGLALAVAGGVDGGVGDPVNREGGAGGAGEGARDHGAAGEGRCRGQDGAVLPRIGALVWPAGRVQSHSRGAEIDSEPRVAEDVVAQNGIFGLIVAGGVADAHARPGVEGDGITRAGGGAADGARRAAGLEGDAVSGVAQGALAGERRCADEVALDQVARGKLVPNAPTPKLALPGDQVARAGTCAANGVAAGAVKLDALEVAQRPGSGEVGADVAGRDDIVVGLFDVNRRAVGELLLMSPSPRRVLPPPPLAISMPYAMLMLLLPEI